MAPQLGLYEQLINKLVTAKLQEIDKTHFYIQESSIDKNEAARVLSQYLIEVIKLALSLITGDDCIEKQIDLSNRVIRLLRDYLNDNDFNENIIETEAKILTAIFSKIDAPFVNFEKHLKEITPYTRLSQSELFTGNNAGISLESEIKKEILSSNKIIFLVSFIKW